MVIEKFTIKAREALYNAQVIASLLEADQIGPEHLLLGLSIAAGSGGCKILHELGAFPDKILETLGHQDKDIGLNDQAKKIIERSVDEARQLRQDYITTEHLLLGIFLVGDNPGSDILKQLHIDIERVRSKLPMVTSTGKGVGDGGC